MTMKEVQLRTTCALHPIGTSTKDSRNTSISSNSKGKLSGLLKHHAKPAISSASRMTITRPTRTRLEQPQCMVINSARAKATVTTFTKTNHSTTVQLFRLMLLAIRTAIMVITSTTRTKFLFRLFQPHVATTRTEYIQHRSNLATAMIPPMSTTRSHSLKARIKVIMGHIAISTLSQSLSGMNLPHSKQKLHKSRHTRMMLTCQQAMMLM
mmetsp:Transcript_27315/g.41873  ORF Transcript_27315/g.41873 Transcript_27315/m.41873 type:complete len:210 (-) Transcript_27315:1363-1992(-)